MNIYSTDLENPMLLPAPEYVPPVRNIVSYDLSDLYKQADAVNREMARKERERGERARVSNEDEGLREPATTRLASGQ